MLQEYARFLARNLADDLAADYAARLRAKGFPILRLLGEVSEDRLAARCRKTIGTLLTMLEAGDADGWIHEKSRALREDRMPGVAQEDLTPQDVLETLDAQKISLLRFMKRFTSDAGVIESLAIEIDELFGRAKLEVFAAYASIRDRLARTLQTTNEQLAEAQSIAHIGSWEFDIASNEITWSDELYRIFGLDRSEFEATYEAYLARIHPDDRDRLNSVIQAACADRSPYTVEHRMLRPDGSLRWVFGKGKVHLDEGGNVVRLTGIAQDITDRKRAEQALERYTADLEAANAHLTDLDRLKDDFLAVVSHELRTPLNFIMGFSSVLEEGIGGELSDQQQDFVRRILEGSKRMQRLVDNLLQMARMRAGKFDLVAQPVDLGRLVAEAAESLERVARAKKIALEVDAPRDYPLSADAQRIGQVLNNLLENAIKFSPQDRAVRVIVRRAGRGFRVEVRDQGYGISAENLPRLFRRFEQLDMSATRVAGGSGLGLSISKSLVEAHGGTIGVESTLGTGSTFWFELPPEPPAEAAGAAFIGGSVGRP